MVQIQKFALGDDWVPKKLDISLDVPQILDLEHLRSSGLQPWEELLPESRHEGSESTVEPAVAQPFEFDSAILAQLCDIGFPLDGCKRALYNTNNGDIETTMNWIMEHMADPDFSEPFTLNSGSATAKAGGNAFIADSESLATIISMGFSQEQALRALKATVYLKLVFHYNIPIYLTINLL
jgi:ubiquitin carboxyl-terminal hydrolase 5/13